MPEKFAELGVMREAGWLYFLDSYCVKNKMA
jgi:hypothetical protein